MCLSNNNDKNGLTSITNPNRFYKKHYEFTRVIREVTVQSLHAGKEVEPSQLKIVKIQQILKLGCAGKFQNQREEQGENA
jgi:hypothetical protein